MREATRNRLLSETYSLQTRTKDLSDFIESDKFKELNEENQHLLKAQLEQMRVLLRTLRRRLYINP